MTGAVDDAQQRYNGVAAVPYHLPRPDQVAGFSDGLDLVEPGGVVPCPRWKRYASGTPGTPGAGAGPADEAAVYCGRARKP